jgi:hypothetical protein
VVCGTGEGAGKTTAAVALVRRAVEAGRRVGAAKVGGGGSCGDRWLLSDAGASPVLDHLDAGYPTLDEAGPDLLAGAFRTLTRHLATAGVDDVVIELGGGVLDRAVQALLGSASFVGDVDQVVLTAHDAPGALAGVNLLRRGSLAPVAVSGAVVRSRVASEEAALATGLPVLPLAALTDPTVALAAPFAAVVRP